MRKSDQINEISAALAKLQSEIKCAAMDGKNSHFKSGYSTLQNVWDSIRGSLGRHAICVTQDLATKENCVSITTMISHSSGQWIEFGPLEIPFAKRDAHSVGSACTYAKRYSLCACLGIVSGDEDDDGNMATNIQAKPIALPEPVNTSYNSGVMYTASASIIASPQQTQELDVLAREEGLVYRDNLLTYFSQKNGIKYDNFDTFSKEDYEKAMKSVIRKRDERTDEQLAKKSKK